MPDEGPPPREARGRRSALPIGTAGFPGQGPSSPAGAAPQRALVLRRGWVAQARFDQVEDFVGIGVAAKGLLREDQLAVQRHFKDAAAGGHQLQRAENQLVGFEQLVREAHGPRGVVSMGTVDDLECVHSYSFLTIIDLLR